MALNNIENIWKSYDQTLKLNLQLNQKLVKDKALQSSKNQLHKLLIARILEFLIYIAIATSLCLFIKNHLDFTAPTIAAGILFIFNIIGLSGSIGQLILINDIDYAQPVIIIQGKIQTLKSHALAIFKLIILSIPFYMCYIILGFKLLTGYNFMRYAHQNWLIAQFIFSAILMVPVIFLYVQLSSKHMHKKWVRKTVELVLGSHTLKAEQSLLEIEKFKNEA